MMAIGVVVVVGVVVIGINIILLLVTMQLVVPRGINYRIVRYHPMNSMDTTTIGHQTHSPLTNNISLSLSLFSLYFC